MIATFVSPDVKEKIYAKKLFVKNKTKKTLNSTPSKK